MSDDELRDSEGSEEETEGEDFGKTEEIPFEETGETSEVTEEEASEETEEVPFEETREIPGAAKEDIPETPEGAADVTERETSEENSGNGHEKKRISPRTKKIVIGSLIVLAVAAVIFFGNIYISGVSTYRNAFFPNTEINGYDVSDKTAAQAEDMIGDFLDGYVLTLIERNGETETLTGKDVGLHLEFGGVPEAIIENQNPYMWPVYLFEASDFTISTEIACYGDMLEESLASLRLMDESLWLEPQEARISDYESGIKGYEVIPAFPGTAVLSDNVWITVAEAVLTLEEEVDLDAAGCYANPADTETDPVLTEAVTRLNNYTNTVVNYTFGDDIETLDGDTIHDWITLEEDYTVTLDEDRVKEFISELAEEHNTVGKDKNFHTTYGYTVTISNPKGTYGWKIDENREFESLLEELEEGATVTREPEYSRRAAGYGDNEYGDTYVEINLEEQHLWFYKDGELVVESDLVSGNTSRNMGTPDGAYYVFSRERNRTLVGEDYETPVNYWMPFNGNIGLHDATWRGSFGGTIYKTNGSHGCINLPLSVAQTIYENITVGDPVMCYFLDPSTIPEPEPEEEPEIEEEEQEETEETEEEPVPTTAAPAPTTAAPAPTEALPAPTTAAPAPTTAAPEPAQTEPEVTETDVPETAAASTEGEETDVLGGDTTQSTPEETASPEGPGWQPETAAEPAVQPEPEQPVISGGDAEGIGPGFQ